MNGCKKCPAYAKCTETYRGSGCAALRYTYGLENDPKLDCADREKLIELLVDVPVDYELCIRIMGQCPTLETQCYECLADYLLANGVTFAKDTDVPSKWISVEDEKPKRRGHYFIAYKFGDSDMRFYGEAFWHDSLETDGYVTGPHFSNEGMEGMKVTHWMKIPKLPEPQKEG